MHVTLNCLHQSTGPAFCPSSMHAPSLPELCSWPVTFDINDGLVCLWQAVHILLDPLLVIGAEDLLEEGLVCLWCTPRALPLRETSRKPHLEVSNAVLHHLVHIRGMGRQGAPFVTTVAMHGGPCCCVDGIIIQRDARELAFEAPLAGSALCNHFSDGWVDVILPHVNQLLCWWPSGLNTLLGLHAGNTPCHQVISLWCHRCGAQGGHRSRYRTTSRHKLTRT